VTSSTDSSSLSAPARTRRLPVRVKASLVHLAISLSIASVLLAIVFFVWYPAPYRGITGVGPIFAMLFGIDVTLGPFITLIIFNPKKKSLPFDLAFIACVQLAALAYGTYSVFIARPVYIVFNVDRFDMVLANDVEPKSAAKAQPAFRSAPITGPEVVAAHLPTDREERNKILLAASLGGSDVPQLPEYYQPYADALADVKSRLKPLAALRQHNAKASAEDLAQLKPYEGREDKFGYVPMRGKLDDLAVIINRDTGAIDSMVRLNPW
jgi:hypothetical protein